MPRPLIVGEAGRTPWPFEGGGSSGIRLCSIADTPYLRRDFDLVNLLSTWPGKAGAKGDRFPLPEARAAAEAILAVAPHGTLVLCGRRVARAFALPPDAEFFSWSSRAGKRLGLIPHPSGVVRTWNDPAMVEAARAFLREARRDPTVAA